MEDQTTASTFCRLCFNRCSLKATISEGKLVKIEPDKESGLESTLCPKGIALPEILNHPERLKYPLKRSGARGENKWRRISWDEALDFIADKLKELKECFGPECVALVLGDPKGLELAFVQRFASAFRTPNVVTPGHLCHVPGEVASTYTFGSACYADTEHRPSLILVWGSNPLHTRNSMPLGRFNQFLSQGTRLVVIDPRKTELASKADLWLRLRPGSDGALAMGMIKVIIEEKLYDEDFVSQWTLGFDQLKEHMASFSLEDVEGLTWIPQEQIREVARLYAQTKPAVIQWGNALDHSVNSFQTLRAISILRAITGNLGIPGGEVLLAPLPIIRPGYFMLLKEFLRKPEETLGGEFKLAVRSAFSPRQSLVKGILEEKPYPIKGALLFGTNPLVSFPNAKETYQALMKLELLVVAELFMTPSAALADVVLPVAANGEFNELGPYPPFTGVLQAYPKLVEPPGECWSDIKIINELAKKLGLGKYFWENEEEALDLLLQPSGLSFQEFKQKRVIEGEKIYRPSQDGRFRTPSGKVEIYSERLKNMGYSPIPTFDELSQTGFNRPELTEEYPLVLTSAKEPTFCHSAYRNITSLRKITREPSVELNPETAQRLGVKEGEWVYIETRKGRIKQKLALNNELDPRVVVVSYGWWFPEKGPATLYGWDESNLNLLTENDPPHEPTMGSVALRGIPCRVLGGKEG